MLLLRRNNSLLVQYELQNTPLDGTWPHGTNYPLSELNALAGIERTEPFEMWAGSVKPDPFFGCKNLEENSVWRKLDFQCSMGMIFTLFNVVATMYYHESGTCTNVLYSQTM